MEVLFRPPRLPMSSVSFALTPNRFIKWSPLLLSLILASVAVSMTFPLSTSPCSLLAMPPSANRLLPVTPFSFNFRAPLRSILVPGSTSANVPQCVPSFLTVSAFFAIPRPLLFASLFRSTLFPPIASVFLPNKIAEFTRLANALIARADLPRLMTVVPSTPSLWAPLSVLLVLACNAFTRMQAVFRQLPRLPESEIRCIAPTVRLFLLLTPVDTLVAVLQVLLRLVNASPRLLRTPSVPSLQPMHKLLFGVAARWNLQLFLVIIALPRVTRNAPLVLILLFRKLCNANELFDLTIARVPISRMLIRSLLRLSKPSAARGPPVTGLPYGPGMLTSMLFALPIRQPWFP